MILTGKVILIISPQNWGENFVSKHHYATELAKRGNEVCFLNPPSTNDSIRTVRENLRIVSYKPMYRGLSIFPTVLSAWLIKKEITRLEQLCNTCFDIIWNFDSNSFFNLRSLKEKLRISHIVDYSENRNLKLLNSTADICFSTSSIILDRQKTYNSNSFNIGHGYAHYTDPSDLKFTINNKSIKVGYVGNLLIKYLDWELIYTLAKSNPKISFYFVGPHAKNNLSNESKKPLFLDKTMNTGNTFFLGPIKPNQIQSFLMQMDIMLLVYKADEFKEQLANPHKLMEYLGSGKVVVATNTLEFKKPATEGLIAMSNKNYEFPELFKEVLNNLNNWNNLKKQQLRIDFALNNTYDKHIERIAKLVKSI